MNGRGRLRVHSAPQRASRRTWGLDTVFPQTNMTSHPIPSPPTGLRKSQPTHLSASPPSVSHRPIDVSVRLTLPDETNRLGRSLVQPQY